MADIDYSKYGAISSPEIDYSQYGHVEEKAAQPAQPAPTVTQPKKSMRLPGVGGAGFKPMDDKQFTKFMKEGLIDASLGASQSFANYPIKIANLFKDNKIKEFNFAPENEAGRSGGIAGDVGSFFMPGAAFGAAAKAAGNLPKIGQGINAINSAVKSSPFANGLAKIGKAAGETALFDAAHNPENPMASGAKGAAFGGGTQAAINLLATQNPIIRLLARAGLGAGVGSMFGSPATGAMIGISSPALAKAFGLGGKEGIAEELLDGLSKKDISKSMAANERLGTRITPAEASGNPVSAAIEGNFERSTSKAAQTSFREKELQHVEQRRAVNKMLDSIYKPSPENERHINALYEQSYSQSVKPEVVTRLKKNAILNDAFEKVRNTPAFEEYPETGYRFLAQVDRKLAKEYQSAYSTDKSKAHEILDVKKAYNAFLKDNNYYYGQATRAAQPKIVRENIEYKLNKENEDITGKNFYNKFLNSRKSYRDVLRDTSNFPEAQTAIKDMRQAWKNLKSIDSVSSSAFRSSSGLSHARDHFKAIIEHIKTLSGTQRDVEAVKMMYSKDWDKNFDKIMHIKDQKERNRELMNLLGRVGVAYGSAKVNQKPMEMQVNQFAGYQ